MKRIASILISILIGALAVAVGMGVYLYKANQDRERLSALATAAEKMIDSIQDKQEQAIREANKKLEDANIEVAKAQIALRTLEEERKMIAVATMLQSPKPSQLRNWKDAIDLQLGVSLKYPSNGNTVNMDAGSLTIQNDARWFSITRWEDRLEQELLSTLTTSTQVSYLSQGKLLVGRIGATTDDDVDTFVLKVRAGSSTFLIWARDPYNLVDHKTILQMLSTLDFPS